MPDTLVTPAPTLGIELYIYISSAYVKIGGLYDLTPPNPVATAPQNVTSHDDATQALPTGMPTGAAIERFTPSKLFSYSDVVGEYFEDTAVSRNAGQVGLEQALNIVTKFKVAYINASGNGPIFFNAIPLEASRLPNPIEGKLARRFVLKPTGVPPAS